MPFIPESLGIFTRDLDAPPRSPMRVTRSQRAATAGENEGDGVAEDGPSAEPVVAEDAIQPNTTASGAAASQSGAVGDEPEAVPAPEVDEIVDLVDINPGGRVPNVHLRSRPAAPPEDDDDDGWAPSGDEGPRWREQRILRAGGTVPVKRSLFLPCGADGRLPRLRCGGDTSER